MTRKARCACGRCTLEAEGETVVNGVCHCASCKQRTGSAFGWSAYFPDERISAVAGPLTVFIVDDADPQRQQRSFCAHCGTTLLWKAASFPGHTGVAGGCFYDPPLEEPSLSASETGKLAWLGLPDGWARMS
jgi:hypothetical protein